MRLWNLICNARNQAVKGSKYKQLGFEGLESKRMLAIVWANASNDAGFNDAYGSDQFIARDIVDRAIDDWNSAITDQDFDNDSNALTHNYELNVFADDLGVGQRGVTQNITLTSGGAGQVGWDVGVPMSADITLDDDGGGTGWFFDETPLDDVEFTGIADDFQASFVDATTLGQARQNDFYRTITHEIGHALGMLLATPNTLESGNYQMINASGGYVPNNNPVNTNDFLLGTLTPVGVDQSPGGGLSPYHLFNNPDGLPNTGDEIYAFDELWKYTYGDGSGRTVTFTESGGGHVYEGPLNSATPGATAHPNELMNAGRVVPAGNNPTETTRQFISDLDVSFLADAYDYSVTLPSTINNAHTSFDPVTGALLVQGSPGGVNDSISITLTGTGNDTIHVVVDGFAEDVATDDVKQILIAGNGGSDSISVASALSTLRQDIDYVVSSNEDAIESSGVGDGVVDLSSVIPGNQTTLRGAIRDANAKSGDDAIYVGRGHYNLTRTGTEAGNASVYDLDITEDATIIGAGAGATIVDGSTNNRIFDIDGNSLLTLSEMTLTGGYTSRGGAINLGDTTGSIKPGLSMSKVSVVGNSATIVGGGIHIGSRRSASITDSVIANNNSTSSGGGIFVENPSTLALEQTLIANNDAANNYGEDLASGTAATIQTNGGNRFTSVAGSNLNSGNLDSTDYLGATDYVVTSLLDTFAHGDDDYSLSIREAVDLANNASGSNEVWLPAWDFMLTRARNYSTQLTDSDVAYGDIDIEESILLRGITGATSVDWFAGVPTFNGHHDKVFDLLGSAGDGKSDATADGGDFLAWQREYGQGVNSPLYEQLTVDFDDDGDVDGDDQSFWQQYYGNTLDLEGVSVLS